MYSVANQKQFEMKIANTVNNLNVSKNNESKEN